MLIRTWCVHAPTLVPMVVSNGRYLRRPGRVLSVGHADQRTLGSRMRGNSSVRFGKGLTEKDPNHGHLAGGLFHLTGGSWKPVNSGHNQYPQEVAARTSRSLGNVINDALRITLSERSPTRVPVYYEPSPTETAPEFCEEVLAAPAAVPIRPGPRWLSSTARCGSAPSGDLPGSLVCAGGPARGWLTDLGMLPPDDISRPTLGTILHLGSGGGIG